MVLALRNMKHRIILILALIICLFLVAPTFATNVEGLNFSIAVDPDTFTSPGKTNVTVRLTNSGKADITSPLALYDPDGELVTSFFDGGSLSQLKIGDTQTWTGEYKVKQSQLDEQKLIFTIKTNVIDASNNVAIVNFPAEAKLNYIGEKVELYTKRSISPEVIRKGNTVKVIYEFVNNGNVRLEDIRIREHSSLSGKAESIKSLEPGSSATVTFERKAAGSDFTSHPNITYKKAGSKETFRTNLDELVIPAAKPNLKLSLVAEPENVNIGEKTMLKLVMENEGNISYSNVSASDKVLGEVFTGIEIPAKQTVTREIEVTMQSTETFKFTLKLPDNTGTEQTETTNELKVSAYDPKNMVRMTLDLTADAESIDSIPGNIGFTVVVTNNSDFEVKDIKLYQGHAQVYTIDALKPGESATVDRKYSVSQGGKFQFHVEVVDSQSNKQTFYSNELQIPYIPATPAPTKEVFATVEPVSTYTPVPVDDTSTLGKGSNILLMAAIVVAGLFAVAFTLFIISSISRARLNRKSENAYDHMKLDTKRDYLNPDTYGGEDETVLQSETVSDGSELPHEKYLKEEAAKPQEEPEETETPDKPEDGAYRLMREDEVKEPEVQKRTRRSDKHQNG